ncbi:translation initiation factor [Prochlorococcus marinus]|uniref:Translation initiation factor SUI1 n=1 Tax=Prochlorococcus marinus (strain MIT 9211) TaxID=93059 RepID=A9BD25_PROM4|nr:translation initiation factor [Prochlorococcus marinus]ABX08113.1 Translation initiation factor SUI1 [Prochlorococcus marinus str. MIT 9211]
MPKGSWREFEDTAVKQTLQSSFQIESKSQLPVRVQKTRVGKGGKTVTVISGLTTRDNDQAKKLLKLLKSRCGTGGTIKGDLFELQGDQVSVVLELLKEEGYHPKKSGS